MCAPFHAYIVSLRFLERMKFTQVIVQECNSNHPFVSYSLSVPTRMLANMRPNDIINPIILGFGLVSRLQALTIYVDASCNLKAPGTVDEVKKMATSAKSQLADAGNDAIGASLKQLFKVDRSSASTLTKVSSKSRQFFRLITNRS